MPGRKCGRTGPSAEPPVPTDRWDTPTTVTRRTPGFAARRPSRGIRPRPPSGGCSRPWRHDKAVVGVHEAGLVNGSVMALVALVALVAVVVAAIGRLAAAVHLIQVRPRGSRIVEQVCDGGLPAPAGRVAQSPGLGHGVVLVGPPVAVAVAVASVRPLLVAVLLARALALPWTGRGAEDRRGGRQRRRTTAGVFEARGRGRCRTGRRVRRRRWWRRRRREGLAETRGRQAHDRSWQTRKRLLTVFGRLAEEEEEEKQGLSRWQGKAISKIYRLRSSVPWYRSMLCYAVLASIASNWHRHHRWPPNPSSLRFQGEEEDGGNRLRFEKRRAHKGAKQEMNEINGNKTSPRWELGREERRGLTNGNGESSRPRNDWRRNPRQCPLRYGPGGAARAIVTWCCLEMD